MKFNTASDQEILDGEASDVYFERSIKSMEKDAGDDQVTMEVTTSGNGQPWVVFCGLDEVITLLSERNVTLNAIPEGTVIGPRDCRGVPVPFLSIRGKYEDIGRLETAILGFICQATGIATASSRIRIAAGDLPYYSFGIRRMHPAISPMIDRASFIGGADGVSGILGARIIGKDPVGTMPHAISLLLGDRKAWKLVSSIPGRKVMLIDTFQDEKFAAVEAASLVKGLDYVRLDTHSTRRGNFPAIVREVRWELDIRGYRNVKIMVSGGLDEASVRELRSAGAEAFGVGTSVSSAKVVDFSLDIVEINGSPITKRGKFSASKKVFRCLSCLKVLVTNGRNNPEKCECGGIYQSIMKTYLTNGVVTDRIETPDEIRTRALSQLRLVSAGPGS